MDTPRENLYFVTVFCLRLLWDEIYDAWTKVSGDLGLTVTEEQILWVVWLFSSSTLTDIARRLRRDKGTISKGIFSLEESGLVIRKVGEDRRTFEFEITKEGQMLCQALARAHGKDSEFFRAFQGFTQEEQEYFADLILRLARDIEGDHYAAELIKHIGRIGESDIDPSKKGDPL
ncbi:MAG: winged helix DNA-binding protein [Firmicutes bacterium]|jgi:DNA-binding MarR family transcriptional regulator|nr:winged helix DNA-binding protein [Bacillota bacterium]